MTCMREDGGVYRVIVGRPEDKRPLGRTRRRWEDDIKMDLTGIWIDGGTRLTWLRKVSTSWIFERSNEPTGFMKKGYCFTR